MEKIVFAVPLPCNLDPNSSLVESIIATINRIVLQFLLGDYSERFFSDLNILSPQIEAGI